MLKHTIMFAAVVGFVLALAPAALAAPVAWGNLMGYWTFDDDTANDSSGNDYHGVTTNTNGYSTDVPSGLSGKSIDMGSDGYVTVSTGGTEDVFDLDTFSVGFWAIKRGAWNGYVGKFYDQDNDGWMVGRFDNGSDLAVRLRGTTAGDTYYGWHTTAAPGWDGGWHYISFTYDGSEMAAYIDGGLFDSDPCTGPIDDTTSPLWFGGTGTTWRAQDKMDEITVFDRALTSTEISLLYAQGGYPLPEPATMALLAFGACLPLLRRRRR